MSPQTTGSEKNVKNTGVLQPIVTPLLAWYDRQARVLPWRSHPVPYHVWVSEIMLQQTRVEAVIPYFERFLREIPTIEALAAAEEQQLLKLWEGLGYYNRVKNLKQAAMIVVAQYGGELPADEAALKKLPGIGEYTAGAIASIAFGLRAVAVDGNVLRVVTRLLADKTDITSPAFKKAVAGLLYEITPAGRTGDFTQAMMELGATVCLPNGEPLCPQCPLASLCACYVAGNWASFPTKIPKKARRIQQKTVFLLLSGQHKVALQQRDANGLLSGLWELPNVEGFLTKQQVLEQLPPQPAAPSVVKLKRQKHIFTHIEWQMQYYLVDGLSVESAGESTPSIWPWLDQRPLFWVGRQDLLDRYPLPKAFHSYYEELLSRLK